MCVCEDEKKPLMSRQRRHGVGRGPICGDLLDPDYRDYNVVCLTNVESTTHPWCYTLEAVLIV